MRKLIETNPYVREQAKREAAVIKFVIDSSAVEGIDIEVQDLEAPHNLEEIDVPNESDNGVH
jgi:Fic family protein